MGRRRAQRLRPTVKTASSLIMYARAPLCDYPDRPAKGLHKILLETFVGQVDAQLLEGVAWAMKRGGCPSGLGEQVGQSGVGRCWILSPKPKP